MGRRKKGFKKRGRENQNGKKEERVQEERERVLPLAQPIWHAQTFHEDSAQASP